MQKFKRKEQLKIAKKDLRIKRKSFLLAEKVGFEPTCPCGQPHFECGALRPLRYFSMLNFDGRGLKIIISRGNFVVFSPTFLNIFSYLHR